MTGPIRPRVVHTAQALVDEVVEVDALPPRGGNAVGRALHRRAGGAVTVLQAAARDGAAAVLTGSVGTGPHGDLVRAALAADGVQVASPPVPDVDTGLCLVVVEASAERTFITTWGAERRVSADTLLSARPVADDLLCISGFTLQGPTAAPLLRRSTGSTTGSSSSSTPGPPSPSSTTGSATASSPAPTCGPGTPRRAPR